MKSTRNLLFMMLALTGILACRKQVDAEFQEQLEKENLKWTLRISKIEMRALEHQMVMSELQDTVAAGFSLSVRDSVKRMTREWNAAFEVVSNRMEEFLDENEAWLNKLKESGMSQEVSEAWWKNRQSQFNEIEQQAKGLEELFEQQFR